jgi:hypothetical protein
LLDYDHLSTPTYPNVWSGLKLLAIIDTTLYIRYSGIEYKITPSRDKTISYVDLIKILISMVSLIENLESYLPLLRCSYCIRIMRLFAFILFIFCSNTLLAQNQESVRISGTIVNAEDSSSVPFVHIINVSKRTGLTSDQHGRFSLVVPKDDTLYFSSVGFKIFRISFKDSIQNRFEGLRIWLQPETITLNPVEIRAYNLEEILNKAREPEFSLGKEQPQPLFEPKERVERPTMGLGVSPGGGAALEGAITAFANLFNREFKQRKRLQEILAKEAINNQYIGARLQLENNYKEIAGKMTGLNGADLQDFFDLYLPDFEFLLYAGDYDLALRIYNDFRDYRYKYRLEEVSLDELMENAKFRK